MEHSLWEDAAKEVAAKWQEQLRALTDLSCGPSALLSSVSQEQADCRAKQWKYQKPNGQKVYVRDILEKVAFWLEKVKDVGDVLVQYDPAHASLPWAGARFLLTAATSDINKYGAMLESIEVVVHAISRYALIEEIYCWDSTSEASQQLRKSVVEVYSAILVFLCKAKKYFAQNAAQRIALSLVQLGRDSDDLTRDIATKDTVMEKVRSVVDGERAKHTLDRVESLRGEMRRMRSDAQALKNLLLDLENPMAQISLQLECIQDGLDKQERRKIMRWLSTEQYTAHHKTIARTRLPGSGLWLFKKLEYQKWWESSLCSLLWLHGDPGAGKSVLTSLVIDRISEELKSQANPPRLAYFYCTRESSEPKRANPTEIILSILRQLSCKNDETPILPPVAEKWQERLSQGSEHRLDLDECVDVVLELMKERPAIIVIDALDECQRETRSCLLEGLDRIAQEAERLVKVFVSSRRDSDIRNHFRKTPKLEIAARDNSQDIENYVSSELDKKIATGKLLNGQPSKELVADVKAKLIERAEGIFRWVSASIQTLCDPSMQFEQDIRLALEQLPPTLEGVYTIIIAQIHKGPPLSMLLAKKALRWLLCTQQPLRSDEFLKALSADLDISNMTITVENLLNICCNLVKYDSELDVVRFIHLSVREYLESREPEYEKSLSHSAVATACLQTCFHGSKSKRKAHLKNAQNKAFYDYAMVYWPVHCVQSGAYRRQGRLGKLFNDFIYDKKYRVWLGAWEESWEEMDLGFEHDSAEPKLLRQLTDCQNYWPNPICQIFLASAFGFMEILQDGHCLKEKDWKKENYGGYDPFTIAVRHGQGDVVEHLVTSSRQESTDEEALIAAVSMSHKKMASYLLEQNPQLSITEDVIESAVSAADVETVQFLFTKADRVEVTTALINIAVRNEVSGKQIIDFLLNLDQEVSIADHTIELACANRRHGFTIFKSLLPRISDGSITDEAMENAASNSKCGLALLNALFHRASHLEVTAAMIEAACSNLTLEPLRFLLSRNETAPISYGSLWMAVSNQEVGNQMLELLLEKCKPTLLDESLLLTAMGNRKLGVNLTKLLLAKASGTTLTITMDMLEAAAGNKHLGEALIREFLKDSKGWKLHPDVATAAARNHYSPVEVLALLLKADEHLEITMDTIIAAVKNPQYALELLEFILSQDPNITITSAVIEAAAANGQSGFDVIQFLWRSGQFPVTPAAFKAAAGNKLCGDKIIGVWLRTQLPDIPPVAVEAAMKNSSFGPEILRLLLRTGKADISSKAIEYASANHTYGPALINTIIGHRGTIEVTEELLAAAVRNPATGSEVLEILLPRVEPARVTPAVIEAAAMTGGNLEVITTLFNVAEPASVTSEAVQEALKRAGKAITVLKCFLGKNPNVSLTPEALETIIDGVDKADALVEIFEFLETCGKDVQISEVMIKRAVEASTLPVLSALAEHCDRRREAMPLTQEVIEASLRRQDSEAPATLEYLLKTLLDRGETIQVEENMILIAVSTPWADKALKMLSELNGGVIPTSPKVIDQAVVNPQLSNSIIENLLGIEPRRLRELRGTETAIMAFIKNADSDRALKKWLLALEQPVQVSENVMKAAAGRSMRALATILDILRTQGQEILIPSLISLDVVQAAGIDALNLLQRTMCEYNRLTPITSEMVAKFARWGIDAFKFLSRILRRQGQEGRLPELVTEEVVLGVVESDSAVRILMHLKESRLLELITGKVVLEAVKSRSAVQILTFLKDALGDERFCGLLSESHLMIAAGAMNYDCIDFLYPLVPSAQPKQYYEDISAFNSAAWQVRPVHLRKLLERKVFPNAKFARGRSPLHTAIYYDESVTVYLMLKHPEVDPNSTDSHGRTPLSIAASRGGTHYVKALLNRGVDRSIKDKDGKTAEDRAMEAGNYMVARLIRDFGTIVKAEEITKEDESPTAEMERFSLRKSMTL